MPALPGRDAAAWTPGGGGGGASVHNDLTGRDAADAHPIAAITDLVGQLAALIPLAQKAAANGVATLDGDGKLLAAQLPALALSEFLGTVASEAAMLALVGQRGDWAIRSDFNPDRIFILKTDDPTSAANWTDVTGLGVVSVDGLTGAVDLTNSYEPIARAINAQVGVAYTPVPADAKKIVTLANAAAITVTLPLDATQAVPVGSSIPFAWTGIGQPSFVLEAGAAWVGGASPTPGLKLRAVGSFATAVKMAADTWALVGDLAA